MGHQYWRYFLWNFAGRESNEQGAGWLKPQEWFDKVIPELLKNNRARNNYFLLPLLLGIAWIYFHLKRKPKDAFLVISLFFFSGLAITLYLNQPPVEPRERDYTYVGSFYAFSIWIGIGVLLLYNFLEKLIKNIYVLYTGLPLLSGLVPAILLQQNWNDHNRHGRYTAVDFAKNDLKECPEQAILFTAADNDTFPLWYLQEAEEYRTDVRLCNLSLLNMDWYIHSMKQQCNQSAPLPISLGYENYIKGKNEHIYLQENTRLAQGIDLLKYLELIREQNPFISEVYENGQEVTFLPSSNIFLRIGTDKNTTFLSKALQMKSSDKMEFKIPNGLSKSALIVLDIIATNIWKRPLYFNYSSLQDFPFLKPYLQQEGNLYRLLPFKSTGSEGWQDTGKMYKNLMMDASWGSLSSRTINPDPAVQPFVAQARRNFYILAQALIKDGNKAKAKQVLLYALKRMPDEVIPFDNTLLHYPELLARVGEEEKALKICTTMGQRSIEFLSYYSIHHKAENNTDYYLYVLFEVSNILQKLGYEKKSEELRKEFDKYYQNEYPDNN